MLSLFRQVALQSFHIGFKGYNAGGCNATNGLRIQNGLLFKSKNLSKKKSRPVGRPGWYQLLLLLFLHFKRMVHTAALLNYLQQVGAGCQRCCSIDFKIIVAGLCL